MAPVFGLVYFYRVNELFMIHSKKLFDMCNIGEQYEVGYARNVVLRECNNLLDREAVSYTHLTLPTKA